MPRLAAIALAALLIAGCGGGDDETTTSAPAGFDGKRAFEDLRAQVEIGPRPSGSKAAHETAEFIAGRMREAGVDGVYTPKDFEINRIMGEIADLVSERHRAAQPA